MTNTRVKIQSLVENQLPAFIREEFPLAGEFLKQYYISQEYQGSSLDILQNIDNYIKLDSLTDVKETTTLIADISYGNTSIEVFTPGTINPTAGFPDKYGLIKIGNEIISYEYKTSRTFEGCKRGFSGTYESESGDLIFSETFAASHSRGDIVTNLSIIFLKEFLVKLKEQFSPGFSERKLYSEIDPSTGLISKKVNENLFIKQSKDFYSSKGTDESFKILFAALYGEKVSIIKPRDYLFKPSDAGYTITKDIVVEALEGNPLDIINRTLYQDEYEEYNIPKSYAAITQVEKIQVNDREFYKLSFDSDYNRDINLDGILYGNFSIHPKTKVTSVVSSGSSVITVDSTVGFPTDGGVLTYTDINGIETLVSYKERSVTEFYGISGINLDIPEGTDIRLNVDAYAYSGISTEDKIRVRIGSVLNQFIYDNNFYFEAGDTVKIKTLGIDNDTPKTQNWVDNIANTFNVKNISRSSIDKILVETYDPHNFKIGDGLVVIDSSSLQRDSVVTDVINETTISISGSWNIGNVQGYKVRRKIKKFQSSSYSYLNEYSANVQNIYSKFTGDVLVASASLPNYNEKLINPSSKKFLLNGSYSGETIRIVRNDDVIKDHGLYTGDPIYYRSYYIELPTEDNPEGVISKFPELQDGLYYAYRVDSFNIKIAKSKSDIFEGKFILISGNVINNYFEFYPFANKQLSPQNIFKEILEPSNLEGTKTLPGSTGILVNGTEILNYKSRDNIFYGAIESIEVLSPGSNYDVLNPPQLSIIDSVGVGASATLSISGYLDRVDIIDPGFDYINEPTVEITGGNGAGAEVEVNTTLVQHSVSVNAESSGSNINFINRTIGFTTYHKFRDAEEVVYITNNNAPIVGLNTNSVYYVNVVDEKTVKLHKNRLDAISGINTVTFTDYGSGTHQFKTLTKKRTISSIRVINPGNNYSNNKKIVLPVGINTASNSINISSHGYSDFEIVKYSTTGSAVGGLSTTLNYIVTKIDDDNFKLSQIGIGSTSPEFYYVNSEYVDLTTRGTGVHSFNYPPIEVQVKGIVGVSTRSGQDFTAKIRPIFKGSINSTQVIDGGVGYGSSEILNYLREPVFEIQKGSEAQVRAIINDGKISEVLVLEGGQNYNCPPELIVSGNGKYEQLVPIINDGSLVEVKVLNGGTGHDSSTVISVLDNGSGCRLKANIQRWTVNLFEKNLQTFSDDDGVISESLYDDNTLQYSHLYAPRGLRENIYSKSAEGKVLYGIFDLPKRNNQEINSSYHSPIIGWAYDGNPIYGPYGYSTETGGTIRQMRSGYELVFKENRPPESLYPNGFFIEDYEYANNGDLDEFNGRYCVTPDYPNGTYAYFSTINLSSADTDGPFVGYKKPVFPYLIGDSFKSAPNPINLSRQSSQKEYTNFSSKWFRNTLNYKFNSKTSSYDFVYDPNSFRFRDQKVNIDYCSTGSISDIQVVFGGQNYEVNDRVIFDTDFSGGYNAIAKVNSVAGKSVENVSSSTEIFSDVEFAYDYKNNNEIIGFTTTPHNFENLDLVNISGFSTAFSPISGTYNIGVSSESYILTLGIGTTGVTGIATYAYITGDIRNIRENDIFNLEDEQLKVLNVETSVSRLRVLRCYNNTVGTSHSAGSILYENPRKFNFSANSSLLNNTKYTIQKQFYFNPKESVGLGTTSGVGITSTLVFSLPALNETQISIPTRTIYLPGHNFQTGDSAYYNSNSLFPLVVSNNGISTFPLIDGQRVYVARINNDLVGISTVKIGISTEGNIVGVGTTVVGGLLYFMYNGSGEYHSFKTINPNNVFGQISRTTVSVSAAETHGLRKGSVIGFNLYPKDEQTVAVKYDFYHRRMVFDPKSFISSDVDILNNTIEISDHAFRNGDKIIHTSTSPCGGLEDEKIYYVSTFNKDKIRLHLTYLDSLAKDSNPVKITSSSLGTISKINPSIKVYGGKNLKFDLSDSSLSNLNNTTLYSAFDLKFYYDASFKNELRTTFIDNVFEVQRNGRVGIDTTAYVSIKLNPTVPNIFYYKFNTINKNYINEYQKELILDDEVVGYNSILVNSSNYSTNKTSVTGIGSTTFTFQLQYPPENSSYDKNTAGMSYVAFSTGIKGPISNVNIFSAGKNFVKIPGISTIRSSTGSGAILEPSGYNIGVIRKTTIEDIGFDYPSDFSLAPTTNLPEILKIEPLASFAYIGVSSAGKNYFTSPNLVVIDGKTNQVVDDLDLRYELGDTRVKILKNTFGIYNTKPQIIPVNNTNGVGISTIFYTPATKNVTVGFYTGFSDVFPFSIGDRVLIENISISAANTSYRGFNSKNYNYALFTLIDVNPSLGGNTGSVTYNMSEYLNSGEEPGVFDPTNSYGRIIPEKDFPIFDPVLVKNNFIKGETALVDNIEIGEVEEWNSNNEYLKISTNKDLEVDSIISGKTSNTKGLISSKIDFNSYIQLGSFSRVTKGWKYETGFLNNSNQRLHDNLYYQYFSYSIKSRVPYETWNEPVSTLNHTAGFLKFSDLLVESNAIKNTSKFSDDSIANVVADLIGEGDLNCFYNFDLAAEKTFDIDSTVVSTEVLFETTVLTDYFESIGNRVLLIDDISSNFNSNPRPTAYGEISRFDLQNRFQKYLIYVKDRRYVNERQISFVTFFYDNNQRFYINQYGRVETISDLGSFDPQVSGTEGILNFYPNKYSVNNYNVTTLAYSIKDKFSGVGNSSFGSIVVSGYSTVSSGTTCNVVSIANTYSSIKALVEITGPNGEYDFDELSIVSDGTNVELLEYGQITNHNNDAFAGIGLGTYYPYISGSLIKVDLIPYSGIGLTVNTIQVSIGNTLSSGIGSHLFNYSEIGSNIVSIASTSSPIATNVSQYDENYDASYFIIQAIDKSTGNVQMSEALLVDDDADPYIVEYGNIDIAGSLGSVGASKTDSITYLTFTPNPGIDVEVKTFYNNLRNNLNEGYDELIDLTNSTIESDFGTYYGTDIDIKKSFDLTNLTKPIFQRYFNAEDSEIVNIETDTIKLPGHFFVTGEEIVYNNSGVGNTQSIGIGTAFIVGIGTTDKLPSSVYAIKVDNLRIKLASSAEDALKVIPNTLDLTHVGIGTTHSFTSKNQNSKVLITIDNMIQSPVVSTSTTSSLEKLVGIVEDVLYFTGISSFFGGDLIKIDDEIMRIRTVGFGSTNAVYVQRPWLGTDVVGHSTGALIKKVNGNYNIIDNTLHFVDPPYGNIPIGTSTNPPNERDWSGITTSSKFHGRVFLKNGAVSSTEETYYNNYILDDISTQFTGVGRTFTLTSNDQNISGISTGNAIVLINGIFQFPQGSLGETQNYSLSENSGITTLSFTGNDSTQYSDINSFGIPVGGVIVSVGSSQGFGYQPLVAAGGTAIVSAAGTISSISIGNSGSGYRVGIQTIVNVGIQTYSSGVPNIEFVGIASVLDGHVISVDITNPGSGYTSTNPPIVVFDEPLSYSNIPLQYLGSSNFGSNASIDIVVGQGSSVIDFSIKNTGYGYNSGDILTVPIGGPTGIPTDPSKTFEPFSIIVDRTYTDSFSGWTVGDLQTLDTFDTLFDGETKTFPLKLDGVPITIKSAVGSNIDVKLTLLIFLNDILQEPDISYKFSGGSRITFTEPPKDSDKCRILFYKGRGDVDVIFNDIIETIKEGDTVQLNADSSLDQGISYQQEKRVVTGINTADSLNTNPYISPGVLTDETILRPVTWCKQTSDLYIDGRIVSKSRVQYEPQITPTTRLIKSVGIGSTIIFVESVRPFFDPINENLSQTLSSRIEIVSQISKVSASATAIVSVGGTILSLDIIDGGFGYTTSPQISIENPVGLGTTARATATSSISSGIVTSIIITNPGVGYSQTNPPAVLVEYPKYDIEKLSASSYSGDFGDIVGISTVSVGVASTGIAFDLLIPEDSYLRNTSITGLTTISGIETGYYFVAYNTNVGNGVTSLDYDGSVLGIGSEYLDNVYQVASVSVETSSISGYGTTSVVRVVTSISDYNSLSLIGLGNTSFFGNYSWGKIVVNERSEENSYNSYPSNGLIGISTSDIVRRSLPLKYINYTS